MGHRGDSGHESQTFKKEQRSNASFPSKEKGLDGLGNPFIASQTRTSGLENFFSMKFIKTSPL